MPDQLLLTGPQAAKAMTLSLSTLFRLRQSGQLAYLRIGNAIRYDVETVRAWIAANRQGGQGHG